MKTEEKSLSFVGRGKNTLSNQRDKRYHPGIAQSHLRSKIKGFLQEAQRIAHLEPPHIVRILDFGVEDNGKTPFLVMSYAPGGTLRTLYPPGSTPAPLTNGKLYAFRLG